MKAWQLTTGLVALAIAAGQLPPIALRAPTDAAPLRARLDRVVGVRDGGMVGPEDLPAFSEETIERTLRGRRDVQECFYDGQQPWDTFVSAVVVRFRIEPDGRVDNVELGNPVVRDSPFGRCVATAVASTTFAPFSGGDVWVTYRLAF